jgi:hypothetical protein
VAHKQLSMLEGPTVHEPQSECMSTQSKGVAVLSHPVLRPKPDAHRIYVQDQIVIDTARM